jgi:hypothetical protein
MSEQEQTGAEPTVSEEVTADATTDDALGPALNRAERRAQAKGKKGQGTAANPALPHTQNTRGPGTRGGAAGGSIHFQRRVGGK